MTPSFNLITEPWVACVNNRGKPEEVSLLELFERAHELTEIETDSPLNTAALYRLSLAVIHRAMQGPKNSKEWHGLWKQGHFVGSPVIDYLSKQRVHDRFDLFSETHPFYQTPNFKTEKALPVSKLTLERASANNKTLFDHSFDAHPPAFTPKEAANALITAQMFSLGGGKGPTSILFDKHPNYSGCFLNNGVMVLLQGDSLFETLLLNLLVYNKDEPMKNSDDDKPVWERDDFPKPGEHTPSGYLQCLTWRNRHIFLEPAAENGSIVVRQMHLGQGESLSFKVLREPMFVYPSENKTLSLSIDRAFWRDSSTLFAFTRTEDKSRPFAFRHAAEAMDRGWIGPEKSMECMVFGMALSRDKGNALAWRQEYIPVPKALLVDEELPSILAIALDWTEKVGEKLRKSVSKLAALVLTEGARDADRKEKEKLATSLGTESIYWDSLEMPFRGFMLKLAKSQDLSEWKRTVVDNARRAFIKSTENCLTRSARVLRARVKALAYLDGELSKLNSPKGRRAP